MSETASQATGAVGGRLAIVAAALAACLLYAGALQLARPGTLGFPLDDSWIHLALAESLAAGGGLALNPGEPVAASSAPLWTGLVALLTLLPGPVAAWIVGLGVVLHLAAVDATVRLALELDLGGRWAALAGGLTLATGWMVWSALSGLEIPLFAALSLWGMILHLRERRRRAPAPRSLAVLAAACLARPEGLLLVVLAIVDRLLVWRRSEGGGLALERPDLAWAARAALVAAVVVAPVALWNLAVGDSALPTTFAAKAGGERAWWPDRGYLWTALGILYRSQPVSVLLAGAGALALVGRLGGARDRGLLPALWLFGLPLAYAALQPVGGPVVAGNFGRYFFPLFPVLAVVATAGLDGAGRALGRRIPGGRGRIAAAVVAAAILAPTAIDLWRGAGRYVQTVANVEDGDVRVARWLAERLTPGAVVAVNDIGALKVHLPGHRVVDLAGIAHPELRRYLAQGPTRAAAVERFLADQGADLVVVFPGWFPDLVRDPRFRAVERFEIANNVTLGDDEIWILETPWSRAPLAGGAAGEETSDGA